MSWYVRHLLEQSDEIRDSILSHNDSETMDIDFDRDEYSDLLSIEMAMDYLYDSKILSEREVLILNFVRVGATVDDIILKMPISKMTVYTDIKSACNKIAFYLGGHFSDHGFLDKLSEHFDNDSLDKIKKYMETDIL
jgi:DNA-binding NarL/FixJ family response regulator